MKMIKWTLLAMVAAGMVTGCGSSADNTTDGNAGKKLQKITTDTDGDGVVDSIEIFSYDEQDRLLTLKKDQSHNHTLATYIYDDTSGNNIEMRVVSQDYAEGSYQCVYRYDSGDNVISRTCEDARYEYEYDKSKKLAKPQAVAHKWIKDAHYPLKRKSYDRNGDGDFDLIVTYTNDDKGNPLTISYRKTDESPVAYLSYDDVIVYQYNAQGKMTSKTLTRTYEGDSFGGAWRYSYNADERVVGIAYDNNGDGVADGTFTKKYDSDGNPLSESWVYDDGIETQIKQYTWAAIGGDVSDQLPDFYGYGTIHIYSHLKKDTQLYDIYDTQEIAGTQKAYYHGNASCADYGFGEADRLSSSVASDIRFSTYMKDQRSCFESEVLSSHPMYGDESILFGLR